MPGIYAKPPKRAAFAKEIDYTLRVLKKKETEKKWHEITEVCVPMILDEFALERQKAREEARKDFEVQECKRSEETLSQQSIPVKGDTAEDAERNATQGDSKGAQSKSACGKAGQQHGATSVTADSTTRTTQCQRRALSLSELEARKERDVAEVFFVGGVHSAFCRILQLSSTEPEIGDVMPIIMEYERLLLVEIDPYDIDIGPLPLLIYFLSERNHFYVDIHWQHHELTVMETFLCALISVLEPAKRTSGANCVAGKITGDHGSRSNSDDGTNQQVCVQAVVPPNSAGGSSPAAPSYSSEDQLGISSENDCTLGPCNDATTALSETTRAAVLRLLYRTLFTFPPHRVVSRMATVFDAARCRILNGAIVSTSAFWKSSKGLAQIAHTLAAVVVFGLGAPMAAAVVPASLLWIGASNLIRETRCPCASCELQRRLVKACRMRDEVGVQEAAQDKRQIAYCLVRAGAPRLLKQLFLSLARQQRTALKKTTLTSVDAAEAGHISYIDQALQFSSWVLLLCSWPYEEMHARESLLAFDNGALLDSVLACLPTTHRGFLTSLTAHQRPGATSLLSATLHLLLRAPHASRGRLLSKGNAVLYPLLVHIAIFVTRRDPYTPARDTDAVLKDMPEEAAETFNASDATGGGETHPIPLDHQLEKKAKAPTLSTPPATAEHEEPPTPKVDVLLLAPVVMGLFQSLLCSESQASFEPSSGYRDAVAKIEDSDDGTTSTSVDGITALDGAVAASGGVSNIPVGDGSAGPASGPVSTVALAPQPQSPAELGVDAPVTKDHPNARSSQQPDCPPMSEGRTSGEGPQVLSQGSTPPASLAKTSSNRSTSLPPRERRRLASLGTAACQAFVHIYEYLRPLLATWEGFESRQDFQCRQPRYTSNVSGQNSACEGKPNGTNVKSPAGESKSEGRKSLFFGKDGGFRCAELISVVAGCTVFCLFRHLPLLAVQCGSVHDIHPCFPLLLVFLWIRLWADCAEGADSSSVVACPSSLGAEALVSSPMPLNTLFLPSRVCLAPCLSTPTAGFDYRGFYYAVVSCMLTLVGGMRMQALPQNRWRFAENPAAGSGGTAAIGGLASAARKIMDFQKRELTEVCSYVKNAANLVIMRAEQASAVSLRHQTTQPGNFRLLS